MVFESPSEARRATQKDRETFAERFGDRYVRVYPSLESDIPDMQAAALQQALGQQVRGFLLGVLGCRVHHVQHSMHAPWQALMVCSTATQSTA